MTRKQTATIMEILATAYPRFYSGPNAPDLRKSIELWAEMFADDDVAIVAAAVKALIASEREFPPLIGTVKQKIRELTEKPALSEAEAWGLISKAVRNSIWDSKKEFDKLPANLQKLVGSPSQLKEWAMMDSETLHSVVASNIQRSYKVIAKREEEYKKLPSDVKRLVESISSKMQLEENKPKEIESKREEEKIDGPTRERIRQIMANAGVPQKETVDFESKRKEALERFKSHFEEQGGQ